jgi:uncharacterized protein (DUF885 family)
MSALRALGACLALASTLAWAAEPAPNKALHALFDREFKNAMNEVPEIGTYLGMPGYDHRLADRSPASVARRNARVKKVIAELQRYEKVSLNAQDRVSRDVMMSSLRLADAKNEIFKGLPFGNDDAWSPISSMNGPQLTIPFIVKATGFRKPADYENYLKRLEALPRQLEQEIATMRAGMRSGWMPPRDAILKVPEMFNVFAGADVKATPMWRPFEEFPRDFPEADKTRFIEAGRKVLGDKVHPAFAALKRFYEAEYVPAARKEFGASTLPGGPAYYNLLIRESTTTSLTADEIHDIGLKEVARLRAEMDEVIARSGFKGTFPEFLKFINSDPQFFYKKPEERLRAYRDIAKRADAELPKLFAELPRMPYGIRPMEEYEGDNSDHYSGPALDGSRAGFFSANVNKLENRPSYEMETTLLHEAVPGHHLQVARAQEIKDLPLFRRAGGYSAYVEGWALYAETLGFDMGFFKDPYQHFGRLQADMLRAVRLVIDTGLHAKGWSRERSIAYFIDNGAGNADYAAAEVDRYIVIPGQALGYKIGQLKILALRDKARAALGERFDLRRFHNAVLDDGALPLDVLEARIDQWIATQRKPVAAKLTQGGKK